MGPPCGVRIDPGNREIADGRDIFDNFKTGSPRYRVILGVWNFLYNFKPTDPENREVREIAIPPCEYSASVVVHSGGLITTEILGSPRVVLSDPGDRDIADADDMIYRF